MNKMDGENYPAISRDEFRFITDTDGKTRNTLAEMRGKILDEKGMI